MKAFVAKVYGKLYSDIAATDDTTTFEIAQ